MIIADQIEYKFRRFLKQSGKDCSMYSFLGVIAECVENKTGAPTDFNYAKEYKAMGSRPYLMRRIANKSVETGFKTIDDRKVKASKIINVGKYGEKDNQILVDKVCKYIQLYSPCVATFRYNVGGSSLIHSKNSILDRVYKYVRRSRKYNLAHAIAITGFDRQKKLFTLTNSWGNNKSHRYLKFDDLYKVWSGGYFVEDVIITKK